MLNPLLSTSDAGLKLGEDPDIFLQEGPQKISWHDLWYYCEAIGVFLDDELKPLDNFLQCEIAVHHTVLLAKAACHYAARGDPTSCSSRSVNIGQQLSRHIGALAG